MITHWQTWDERVLSSNEISHQHLSNIYYYTHFIMAKYYPHSVRDGVRQLLDDRFDGEILKYKPDPKFKEEWDYLKRMGYLKKNGKIIFSEIGSRTHIKLN